MEIFKKDSFIRIILCYLVFTGFRVYAVDYDYSFTQECLENPPKPQYDGGIIVNSEFDEGLKGWSPFGDAKLEILTSKQGNHFIVASNRTKASDSISQKLYLEKNKHYVISAWLQVSHGKVDVAAIIRTLIGSEHTGWVIGEAGCWSMLKGGIMVNVSGPADLYFESSDASVDLLVDSVSVQPFSQEEWKSHQDQSIEKVRKSNVKFQAIDLQGQPLANATIFINQKFCAFPIGNAISPHILDRPDYRDWHNSRFKLTVFENELKWHFNEPTPGNEDFALADAMLKFAKENDMVLRGHNIIWENSRWLPSWVLNLSKRELSKVIDRRFKSVMKRYKGQFIHWDVDNENMHYSFLDTKLGKKNVTASFYKKAHKIDDKPLLFLNEFGTIEQHRDKYATPARYLRKIRELRSNGYDGPLGIGLQGHFDTPNIPYIRCALDTLASANLPIWITELDVSARPNQEMYLDQIIRELHAHPAVNGIMIWSPWQPQGCYKMCLTDNSFKNLATGDIVDKFMSDLNHKGFQGNTDSNGYFETSLFHGNYEVKISHPTANTARVRTFKLEPTRKAVLKFRIFPVKGKGLKQGKKKKDINH